MGAVSEQDRKKSKATYDVGLELVDDAQKFTADGKVQLATNTYRSALKELNKAVELDPLNHEAHYLLATVYLLGFQKMDLAHEHADKALHAKRERTKENYPEAQQLRGSLFLAEGKPKEAIPFFDAARNDLLYATPYLSEQELGWAYFQLGDAEKARMHLSRALAMQPKLCGAYLKLSDVETADGKDDASLAALNAFISECDVEEIRPYVTEDMLAFVYYRKGMGLMKAGDGDGAIAAFGVCTSRFAKTTHAAQCKKASALVP